MRQAAFTIFLWVIAPLVVMLFSVFTPFIPSWYSFQKVTSLATIGILLFFSIRSVLINHFKIKQKTYLIFLPLFSLTCISAAVVKTYWGQDVSFMHSPRELKKEYSNEKFNTTFYLYTEKSFMSGSVDIKVRRGDLPLMWNIIHTSPGNIDSVKNINDTTSFYIFDNADIRGPIILQYALKSGEYRIISNTIAPFDPRYSPDTYKKYQHWEFEK